MLRIFLWTLIKVQKAWLRLRLAWLDFWIWGARNRLREVTEWEQREIREAFFGTCREGWPRESDDA